MSLSTYCKSVLLQSKWTCEEAEGSELWEIYSAYVKDNFPRVRINKGGDHWQIIVREDHFELRDIRKDKRKILLMADPDSITRLDKKLKRGHVTSIHNGDWILEADVLGAMTKSLMADIALSIDKAILDDLFVVMEPATSLGTIAEIELLKQQAEALGKPIITAIQKAIPIGL